MRNTVVRVLMKLPSSSKRSAWTLLIALTVIGGLIAGWRGSFRPVEVPDTAGYVHFPWDTLQAALSNERTPGYPLLLRLVRGVSGRLSWMPAGHYLCYCLAMFMFHAGLLRQGCPAIYSPWIAGSLLTANILAGYMQTIATDTLAGAAGVACCGALLLWLRPAGRSLFWAIALAVCVAAGWLIRPANLFLVPFVVLTAAVLSWMQSAAPKSALRTALLGLAIVAIPLAAWCLLRWQVVGKFGVVSFGGYNLIGISGQFLDEELAGRVSQNLQPLAQAVLERRRDIPVSQIPFHEESRLHYLRMETNYDLTIWDLFVPAARGLYGDDPATVNTRLKELGLELIWLRPGWYTLWVLKAARQALWKLVGDFLMNPCGAVLTVLTAVATLIGILSRLRPGESGGNLAAMDHIVKLLYVLAMIYAITTLLLVIAVCPPLGRMTDAAGVLLAPLVTAVLCDRLSRLGLWGRT